MPESRMSRKHPQRDSVGITPVQSVQRNVKTQQKSPCDLHMTWNPMTGSQRILAALLMASCSNGDFTLEGWMGRHREKLIQTWGQPEEDKMLSDGSTRLVYRNDWGDGYGQYTCRRVFVANDEGIIRSWVASGC
jgi:hypothetical protein